MRRRLVTVIVVFVTCLLGVGVGVGEQTAKKVLSSIAVMNLKCGKRIDKEQCVLLTDIVIKELVKAKKYRVINRADRDRILGEGDFQQAGCFKGDCILEAGRLLGVGKIVVGSVIRFRRTYKVNLQLVNVKSAEVEIAAEDKCLECKIDDLIGTVTNAGCRLMGQAPPPIVTGTLPPGTKGGMMVRIPAGEFIMGSDSGDPDEMPVHLVYLDEFYIDKHEVINTEYSKCFSAGVCGMNEKYKGFLDPLQPVVGVTWHQADTYCKWVGKRLPTEAEWEKAARGIDGRTYPWGEGIDCSKAKFYKCGREWKTEPVGSYPSGAGPYGAMDMAGNVWEWTADLYDANYYPDSPNRNPKGPAAGRYRVLRGGSWNFNRYYLRASARFRKPPGATLNSCGFRCAKTP